MLRATYVGAEHDELKGQQAIVRKSGRPGIILAQFDSLHLPMEHTHAWQDYEATDFILVSAAWDYKAQTRADSLSQIAAPAHIRHYLRRSWWWSRVWNSNWLKKTLVARLGAKS